MFKKLKIVVRSDTIHSTRGVSNMERTPIGIRIKLRREALDMTQEELALKTGYKSKSSINKIEKSINDLPRNKVSVFARVLQTNEAYLMGWIEDPDPSTAMYNDAGWKVYESFKQHGIGETDRYFQLIDEKGQTLHPNTRVPVVGRVAAGLPIEAIENIIDWEEIPAEIAKKGEHFGLVIHGDSMEPRMYDGDIVIVRKQPEAESGQIVIATVNGDDATCKRFMQYGPAIGLVSLNSKYPPMVFSEEQQKSLPIQIWGVVVEIRGKMLGL